MANKKGNRMTISAHLFRLQRLCLPLVLSCAVFFISGPAAAEMEGSVGSVVVAYLATSEAATAPSLARGPRLAPIGEATDVQRIENALPTEGLDDESLAAVHGKGSETPEAAPTTGVAVILWDETGQRGGRNVQIQDTGQGNVQTTSVTYNVQ